MREAMAIGNVPVTVTGVAETAVAAGWGARSGRSCGCTGKRRPCHLLPNGGPRASERGTSMSSGGARRDVGDERLAANGSIPGPRSAADAYRVSDDQIHRARLVVARNCDDPDDLRQLLDMLGLIGVHPEQPPPVGR
jgi:hypothetical protein